MKGILWIVLIVLVILFVYQKWGKGWLEKAGFGFSNSENN